MKTNEPTFPTIEPDPSAYWLDIPMEEYLNDKTRMPASGLKYLIHSPAYFVDNFVLGERFGTTDALGS